MLHCNGRLRAVYSCTGSPCPEDFRDRYLIPNYIGSHLVSLYYAVSPPVADFISRHDTLRSLTRWILATSSTP